MKNICEYCGNSLEEGSNFCIHCGAPVKQSQYKIEIVTPAEEVEEAKAIKSHTDSFVPREPTYKKRDSGSGKKGGSKLKLLWIACIILALVLILPKLVGGKKPEPQPEVPVVTDSETIEEPAVVKKADPLVNAVEIGKTKDEEVEIIVGWHKVEDTWYYHDENGELVVGWLSLDGKDYYLDDSGRMAVGEVEIDGETYIFATSGRLEGKKETTISITSSLYDQDVFYRHLGTEIEELSPYRSYLEIAKVEGPEKIANKVQKELMDFYYSEEIEQWDSIKKIHHEGPYDDGHSDFSFKAVTTRVYEGEKVTTVVIRHDLGYYNDTYGPYYTVFQIDRRSGEFVESPHQISSFGQDLEQVRNTLIQFINNNSDVWVNDLNEDQLFDLKVGGWGLKQSYINEFGKDKIIFLNRMDDLEEEDIFIVEDQGEGYICLILDTYYTGESMNDESKTNLVRIPLDYRGGRLEEYSNLAFFNKSNEPMMKAGSKEIFTGQYDIFSLIYK